MTNQSFKNMLNQKPASKGVMKEAPKSNLWAKMMKGCK